MTKWQGSKTIARILEFTDFTPFDCIHNILNAPSCLYIIYRKSPVAANIYGSKDGTQDNGFSGSIPMSNMPTQTTVPETANGAKLIRDRF